MPPYRTYGVLAAVCASIPLAAATKAFWGIKDLDLVPSGSPKGWIEFYITQVAGGHSPWTVRIVVQEVGNTPYPLETTEFAGVSAPKLRISATPGIHRYRIMHKNTKGNWPIWPISVTAGKLTRVAIEVKTVEYGLEVPNVKRYIDVAVSAEAPVPCAMDLCLQ